MREILSNPETQPSTGFFEAAVEQAKTVGPTEAAGSFELLSETLKSLRKEQ